MWAVTANPMIAEWRTSSLGELRKPVVGDVDPPRDPGVAPVDNMPEDPVEGADAAGSADHPQVKADRRHLRRVRPLAMQPVEGIDHIGGALARVRADARALSGREMWPVLRPSLDGAILNGDASLSAARLA